MDLTRLSEYRAEAAKLTGEASIALLFRYLSASRLVTIAQIEGRVRAAGSEFVLGCDMRFAARESPIFCQFEPAFGQLPGDGGAEHLPTSRNPYATLTAQRRGCAARFQPSLGRDRVGAETGVSRARGPRVPACLGDSWQEWHFDLEEVSDAAGDNVFVAIHEWGTGIGSGASVDQHRYFAVTVRGGQAVRFRMFSHRDDAIEAARLPA